MHVSSYNDWKITRKAKKIIFFTPCQITHSVCTISWGDSWRDTFLCTVSWGDGLSTWIVLYTTVTTVTNVNIGLSNILLRLQQCFRHIFKGRWPLCYCYFVVYFGDIDDRLGKKLWQSRENNYDSKELRYCPSYCKQFNFLFSYIFSLKLKHCVFWFHLIV